MNAKSACVDRVCRAGDRNVHGLRSCSATHIRRVERCRHQSLLDHSAMPVVRGSDREDVAGGEVIVQDSAGYGVVTITQSVSIIAPTGVYAGISVPAGQTGVTVNGAGIVVVLRGLSINGTFGAGSQGVSFVQGQRLRVENCVVTGLRSTGIATAQSLAS